MRLLGRRKRGETSTPAAAVAVATKPTKGKAKAAQEPATSPKRRPLEAEDMVVAIGQLRPVWRVVAVVWYGGSALGDRWLRLERKGVEGWREAPANQYELAPAAAPAKRETRRERAG